MEFNHATELLENNGFTNIQSKPLNDLNPNEKSQINVIGEVEILGDNVFDVDTMYPYDTQIVLSYHSIREECVPVSTKEAKQYNYRELKKILNDTGFVNVHPDPAHDLIMGIINKEDMVKSITVDGNNHYSSWESFPVDTEIVITYHSY